MAYFEHEGRNLHYSRSGRGVPALVFLHGLGSSCTVWQNQVDHFGPSHEIFALDLLGHGESSKNVAPSEALRTSARTVTAFLKSIDRPCVAVGHSWGGNVLTKVDFDSMEKLEGLVFVDSPSMAEKNRVSAFQKWATFMLGKNNKELRISAEDWYRELIGEGPDGVIETIVSGLLSLVS